MITIQNYVRAQSLQEAWELNQNKRSRIIGGMLWLKMGKTAVHTAIDLGDLGLNTIEETEEAFSIGCSVTLRQLELHEGLNTYFGGAIAAASGADFLCYVTPAEHLRLPDLGDVKEGIIASRIAAHAADIAKGVPHARDIDNAMADARHHVDWETMFSLALDKEKAQAYFESTPPSDRHTCSMCGKMCAVRTTNMILEGKKVEFCSEK